MLIFNCTKAAQDFFTVTRKGEKQTIVEAPPCKDMSEDIQYLTSQSENPPRIQQWLLHAVSIKRKHCLIAVEVNTRFGITVTGVKKADIDEYLLSFRAHLSSQVLEYGIENGIWNMADAKSIFGGTVDHFAEIHLFRRYDPSVQARINTIVQDLRYYAEDEPMLLTDEGMLLSFNGHVNKLFCKSKAYPEKAYIKPSEEMLLVWQQLYQNATPEQLATTRQLLSDNEKSRLDSLVGGPVSASQPSDKHEPSPKSDESEMITVSKEPLSEADMDFLHSTLQKYETAVSQQSISSLHGFLTAIVSGPSAIPPSEWMPCIWGNEEEQPAWEDINEVQRFTSALFNMMSNISETLMNKPQDFDAVFMGDEHNTDVSDWCTGYMDGVDLDDDAWDALPDDLSAQLDFLDDHGLLFSMGDQIPSRRQQDLNDKVIGIAQALHAYWLKQRSPISTNSPQRFDDNVVQLRPQQPATSQKTGRNDPCPCGSGKKFKKCCLH